MLFRRKLLLTLIELCGGSVSISDCQALLALLRKRSNKNYYDFFPSSHGYYSLTLAYDKHQLTNLGFLVQEDVFHLQHKHSYLDQLSREDQCMLQTVVDESALKLNPDLFSNHFYTEEDMSIKQVKELSIDQLANRQSTDTPYLFTLGYEGLSIDEYLNLLSTYRVVLLIDIRKNPWSRKYGFSKKQLLWATDLAGIKYYHLPALGIPSNMRRHLDTEIEYQDLFEYYARYILPEQYVAIEQIKYFLAKAGKIALMCFEADPQFCHRHKVTEYLLQDDPTFHASITHLRSEKAITSNGANHTKRMNVPGQKGQNSIYISM